TLTNTGAHPLLVSGFTLSGPNADRFQLSDTDKCTANMLLAGDSCTLTIRFLDDGDIGEFLATLEIGGNVEDGAMEVGLSAVSRKGWIYYVSESATGANTGADWENAFTNLQDALSAARPGFEIWVAKGTYKPTTGTDRNATFGMKSDVAIYGGFTGTETSRDQRRWWEHETILSADIGVEGDDSDNSHQVVRATEVNSGGILDGFIITGANGPDARGAVMVSGGAPTFRNLIVRGNKVR